MEPDQELSRLFQSNFQFTVEGILLLSFGSLGILGNISCIIIFSYKSSLKSFHYLMLWLAIFDSLYILCSIFLFGIPTIYNGIRGVSWYAHLVPVLLPLAQIGLTGSIYLTVSISVERYTTVVHPFFKVVHNWPSTVYILPTIVFTVLYNIPRFFELTTRTVTCTEEGAREHNCSLNSSETHVVATEFRRSLHYRQIYIVYLNIIVHGLIPLVALLYMNISVYRNLNKYSHLVEGRSNILKTTEITLAKISCLIVAVFVVCHSIRWIPNIYELHQGAVGKDIHWPVWVYCTQYLSHWLTVINSSVNFYIYCYKQYRSKLGWIFHRTRHNTTTMTTQTTMLCLEPLDQARNEV